MSKASSRAQSVPWVVGVVLCTAFATLVPAATDPSLRTNITTLFLLTFGVVAASSATWRVGHSRGRRHYAWLSLSIALWLAVLVNAVGILICAGALPASWNTAVDPMLLIGDLIGILALGLFPPSAPRGIELARLILDGFVVGGSVLLIASTAVFPTLLAAGHQHMPFLNQAQILALPVLDLVIATKAILLVADSGRSSRAPLVLVGVAFVLFCLSDMAYAVIVSSGGYGLGNGWNLGWLGGQVLMTMAALNPQAGIPPQEQGSATPSVRSSILFLATFLAAAATTITRAATTGLTMPVRSIWAGLILIVVVRQVMLVLDNDQLRRSLENRVEQRTKEVREISHQRALLVSSVADGIYGVDPQGHITMVNDATTRLLKRPAADLIGTNAHHLLHAAHQHPAPHPVNGCYITRATSSGLIASAEDDLYLRGDGTTLEVEATASPIHSDTGSITGAVVVFRDVSQRREIDRMKREFISVVSHEIRTPLTSIHGALGLIAGGAFGAVPRSMVRMIDIATAGSARLSRLVNDILEINRIDTGQLPIAIGNCDIATACREAVAATEGLAQAAGIQLRCGVLDGMVRADCDRLVQVLINLIGNAVRFSEPDGTVLLEAHAHDHMMEVAVTDTGRGIPADKLEDIFARFSQVDSSNTREKEGTGLGLAICRGLIEAMGGRIWAESTLGKGSTFRFQLPAAVKDRDRPHLTPVQ